MPEPYLGRLPSADDPRTLKLGSYLPARGEAAPSARWYDAVPRGSWRMFGNHTHADCTCAAAAHLIMTWTAVRGRMKVPSDEAVLSFYGHFSKGDPWAGADMLSVLRYWQKEGLEGHRIASYASLDRRNRAELMQAVTLFGGAYVGLGLPAFATPVGKRYEEVPWVLPKEGAHGEAARRPSHGHCVCIVGYDEEQLHAVTWGQLKPMSWEFYEAYVEEAFAALSPDWDGARPGGRAAVAFDAQRMERDLRALRH